jgi:16S rRNA (guanine527-N7)-methyltransferase
LFKSSMHDKLEKPLRLLRKEAEGLQVFLNEPQITSFSLYLEELISWNKKLNLIGKRNETEIVVKDFLDSLMISKYIPLGASLLDIGSGAGFPGIPIKISRRDIIVGLLEIRGKRVSFLKHMIRLLKMDNLEVILPGDEKFNNHFDFSVSRAFGATKEIAKVAEPYLVKNGTVLVMKGKRGEEELKRDLPFLDKGGWKLAFRDKIQLPVTGHGRFIFGLKKIVSRETFC